MTPRRAARTDSNHAEIRDAARRAGYYWVDTFQLGGGFPDAICVSKTHIPVMVEIKSPGEKLTPAEKKFRQNYPGPYCIVYSSGDLLEVMDAWDRRDIETIAIG